MSEDNPENLIEQEYFGDLHQRGVGERQPAAHGLVGSSGLQDTEPSLAAANLSLDTSVEEPSLTTLAEDPSPCVRVDKPESTVRRSLRPLKSVWSLIPNVDGMSRDELLDLLIKCIVHDDEDLLVINKPYGLCAKGSLGRKRTLLGLLYPLSQRLGLPSLRPLNMLDRQITGCVLLSKRKPQGQEDASAVLKDIGIQKEFLCITRGVPRVPSGTIDQSLRRMKSGSGIFRVFPASGLTKQGRGRPAVTDYEVLSAGDQCGLLRTTIKKSQWHQIRCHLGFVLGTPVIGDHKYSDYLSLRPQRLSAPVLNALELSPYGAKDLPMFMHAHRVTLPYTGSTERKVIEAPIPKHFLWLLNKLKLRL